MQGRDNESEAGQKPPDSHNIGVIGIKYLRNRGSKGKEDAPWHKMDGIERGRNRYANANPGIKKKESLESSPQSSLLLPSQLLRLI
ncbi:MAG: hypothetical protein ACXQTW_08375 [Candidatus Methanospirareceae archaeon]